MSIQLQHLRDIDAQKLRTGSTTHLIYYSIDRNAVCAVYDYDSVPTVLGGGQDSRLESGSGAPVLPASSATIYVNSTNGDLYTSDGISWSLISGTANPSSQGEVTAGTAIPNKFVQPDTLKVELDKKQNLLVATSFQGVGAENTLGINTTDTYQTIAGKLNAYIADTSKILKSVNLATSLNLVALQALEPTVTLDDFLFEFDTDGVLTYTVVPLDKFTDSNAYVSHAFKGAVGTVDENIVVFTQVDATTEELDLSRFASGSFLEKDLVQTANRTQNFGTFSQTWNNVGTFTKNYPDGLDVQNFSSVFVPNNAQISSNSAEHIVTVNDGMGISSRLKVDTFDTYIELNNNGSVSSFSVKNGGVGSALGVPQTHIKTVNVDTATATVGQVLTLKDAITGESEFESIVSGGITEWATGISYAVGDTFFAENRIYYVNTAHTSTTLNADRGNFDELVKTNTGVAFSGLIHYYTDEIVLNANRYVKRSIGGTSEATFDNTEAAKWTLVSQVTILPYVSSIHYYEGEKIYEEGAIYQRNSAGTSGATFNTTEKSNWTALSNSAQTIQSLDITGSVSDWNSTVVSNSATAITITLPDGTLANLGKSITIKNNGLGTITVAPFGVNTIAGQVSITTNTAVTYTITATGVINSTSSIDESTAQLLTYGRVRANTDLVSITYITTGAGTPVNFDQTLYSSGTTFSGTNAIIPSVAGRYRAEFLAMAGSGEFNGDGIFHIVQNGVSLGNIFVDIMQAAGVNQVAPFIDVDLVAGQAVTLNYQAVVADAVPWGRGSYFQLSQLPTSVSVVVDSVAESVAPIYAVTSVTPTAGQNGSGTAAQFMTITIPTAGNWDIEWSVYSALWNGTSASISSHISSALYDNSGNLLANSELVSGAAGLGGVAASSALLTGTRSYPVTTTEATTYNIKVWNQNSNTTAIALSNGNGRSYVRARKTSGFLPSTGQTVDFVQANRITSNQSVVLNDTVIYNSISTGNIPYNTSTGVFTLTLGKTYNLFASAKVRNDGTGGTGRYVQFEWVDAVSNAILPGLKQGVSVAATSVLNESGTDNAGGIYTPSTNQTVKVRITGLDGSNMQLDSGRTSAVITQIGSSSVTTLDVTSEYGQNTTITESSGLTSTTFANIPGAAFTLPSAGTWTVNFCISSFNNTATADNAFRIVNSAGATVGNSEIRYRSSVANDVVVTTSAPITITTASPETYNLQYAISAGSLTIHNSQLGTFNTRGSRITWNKIAGQLPSTGQTVDFVSAKRLATQPTFAAGNDIIWDGVETGNIPLNTSTGQFTLTAGKTYRLLTGIRVPLFGSGATGKLLIGWYNVTSNSYIGTQGSSIINIIPTTSTDSESNLGVQEIIFTPTVTTLVSVRSSASSVGTVTIGNSSYAIVQQLGSSNVIAGLYPGTWGTYVPTITAVTTNPTKPTSGIIIDTASYIVEGKKLTVNYNFWIGTAVAPGAGSGTYKFSLPPGYVIDTTKVTTIASVDPTLLSPNIANILGTVELNRGSQSALTSRSIGHVFAADANNFTAAAMITAYGALSMFDSVSGNTGLQSGIGWKMQFTVPIV